LWLLLGSTAAYFAVREIQIRGFVPQRTLEVLEGDKIWIQKEAKIAYEHIPTSKP
jgi:hypothetical protein